MKGVLIHWSIKLEESGAAKDFPLKGFGTALPILIGDQYNSMAYYMISRSGNVELTRIMSLIEENNQVIMPIMFPALYR